jgi:AraC-like DNA-binding protein
MNVQLFAPDSMLQADVQCFWTFEQDQAEQNGNPILPDAHAELIFNCGAAHILEAPNGERVEMPRVSLNGLQNRPLHFRINGICQFIAVRLNAWAMRHFVELPNDICTPCALPLNNVWKDFSRTLEATMQRSGYQAAIDCLQQFLLDIRQPESSVLPLRTAGELLDASCGNVGLNELSARSNLSPRQFERQFKYGTGVSPKSYARLIRHESVRNVLTRDPGHNMVVLAQDFGYTDQAHFIHDFKAFTGYTPGQYAAGVRESLLS